MGLSSSQARLLNLTARMHQIEYKAAKLEAQKLQMANESRRVYDEYLDALEQTKVQVKTLNDDGSASYKDIHSYQNFIDAGYALEFNGTIYNGKQECIYTVPDDCMPDGVYWSNPPGPYYFDSTDTVTGEYVGASLYGFTDKNGTYFYVKNHETINPTEFDGTFSKLANEAFGASYTTEPTGQTFEQIITNLINSGDVRIVRLKDNSETSVAIDTGLQEISDETLLRKAEAKYEADMRKIDAKDRKYDTDLAALEAERNAIKSEMETLKTVAKDNVERTFKLFS
ncbi:MAG: hypothetical protein K6E29_00885 [Cyanobacteria bacterium RUI128]|nr:hypothetical protein [Cyanobacteria bacterium RUI128]